MVPKFSVGNKVMITKYKNIFSKGFTENIFVVDPLLNTNCWTYTIKDLNGEKISGSFYEKILLLTRS